MISAIIIVILTINPFCLAQQNVRGSNDNEVFKELMKQTGTITLQKSYNLLMDNGYAPFTTQFKQLIGDGEKTRITIQGSNIAIFNTLNDVVIKNITIYIISQQITSNSIIQQIINSNIQGLLVNITQQLSITVNTYNYGVLFNKIVNSNLVNVGIVFNTIKVTLDSTRYFGLIASTYESSSLSTNKFIGVFIQGKYFDVYFTAFATLNTGFFIGYSMNIKLDFSYVDIGTLSLNIETGSINIGTIAESYLTQINNSFVLVRRMISDACDISFGAFISYQFGNIYIQNSWVELHLDYNIIQEQFIYNSCLVHLLFDNLHLDIQNILTRVYILHSAPVLSFFTTVTKTTTNNIININQFYASIINSVDNLIPNIYDVAIDTYTPTINTNNGFYSTIGDIKFISINNKIKYINNSNIIPEQLVNMQLGINNTVYINKLPYYYNNKYYGCDINNFNNLQIISDCQSTTKPNQILQLLINPNTVTFTSLQKIYKNITITINNYTNINNYIYKFIPSTSDLYNVTPSSFILNQQNNFTSIVQLHHSHISKNITTNLTFNLSNDDNNDDITLYNNLINITFIYYSLIKPPIITSATINTTHHYIQLIFDKDCYIKTNPSSTNNKYITFDNHTHIDVLNYTWVNKRLLNIYYNPSNSSFNQFIIINIHCGFIFSNKHSIYSLKTSHLIPTNTSLDDFDNPLF